MAQVCTVCHGTGQTFIEFRTRRKPYWKDCVVCDGLGLRNVDWIRTKGGIDHILMSSDGNWHHTVCRSLWSSGEMHRDPKRRCKNCRERVKKGRPWHKGERWPVSEAEANA